MASLALLLNGINYVVFGLAGEFSNAITAFQKAKQLDDDDPWTLAGLGYAYASSGKRAEAEKLTYELKELSKQRYVSSFVLTLIYIDLGEKDQALQWLEKARDERSDYMVILKVDPVFDSLRSDHRFSDMQRRVGLSP